MVLVGVCIYIVYTSAAVSAATSRRIVYGHGITGKSLVRFFDKHDMEYTLCDGGIQYHNIYDINLNPADQVFVSPGCNFTSKDYSYVFNSGAKITNDISAFLLKKKARQKGKIIGITGTLGKSSISYFLSQILTDHGFKVVICGNYGNPVMDYMDDEYDFYIVELSSFQLFYSDYLQGVDVCVLSDLHHSHLDWHGSVDHYYSSKEKLFAANNNAFVCSLSTDDNVGVFKKFANTYKAAFSYNSYSRRNSSNASSTNYPSVYFQDGHIHDTINNTSYKYTPITTQYTNNILAVYCVVKCLELDLGFDLECDRRGVTNKRFMSLEHRLEDVACVDNILIVNDSKSTNLHSTNAAICQLKSAGSLYLLLGGLDNQYNKDLNTLKSLDAVKRIYLFGENRHALHKRFQEAGINIEVSVIDDINNIVAIPYKDCMIGSVGEAKIVLFSPGHQSYDNFKSFVDRGLFFKKLTHELINNIKHQP